MKVMKVRELTMHYNLKYNTKIYLQCPLSLHCPQLLSKNNLYNVRKFLSTLMKKRDSWCQRLPGFVYYVITVFYVTENIPICDFYNGSQQG